MKKLFLLGITSLLFASQLQYFYTDKVYYKIEFIEFLTKIKKTKKITKSEGDGFYRNYYIPYYIYSYQVFGKYYKTNIDCLKKIDFSKLKENTNILKQFKCKVD